MYQYYNGCLYIQRTYSGIFIQGIQISFRDLLPCFLLSTVPLYLFILIIFQVTVQSLKVKHRKIYWLYYYTCTCDLQEDFQGHGRSVKFFSCFFYALVVQSQHHKFLVSPVAYSPLNRVICVKINVELVRKYKRQEKRQEIGIRVSSLAA